MRASVVFFGLSDQKAEERRNERVIIGGSEETNRLIPRGSLQICPLICS